MPTLLKSALSQSALPGLLKYNVSGCLIIFLLLQLWRPHYFLTDDNLSGFYPVLVEMGRHMQHGESPFVSHYLFGGHYDWSRDLGCLCWHPFYLLPDLLADTWLKFWIVDLIALLYLLTTTVGFTILTYYLRNEFKLRLPDVMVLFYTMSFVFCTYILMIGASWLSFLSNQSALPWLTLGILDRKITRGVLLVTLVTLHQFIGSYAGMTMSNSLLLSVFALGVAVCRRSQLPFFIWCAGNTLAYLILTPYLLHVLDGFAHTVRMQGLSPLQTLAFSVPVGIVPFSFFFGNWAEPMAWLQGDTTLETLKFPYCSSLFACGAAWCLVPALRRTCPWRPMETLCLGMAGIILLFVIRPAPLGEAMLQIPILKSLRWPFRETLQFLFFIHLFIILRPPLPKIRLRWLVPIYSLILFLLPLPLIRVPTLNPLIRDRQAVLSGDADRYWTKVKLLLKPTDQVATVIDEDTWWKDPSQIPYTYMGTANFAALYQFHYISGYSTTAPTDQLPLTIAPKFWFGAFDTTQIGAILKRRPDLKIIMLKGVKPLKITLYSPNEPPVDISPELAP